MGTTLLLEKVKDTDSWTRRVIVSMGSHHGLLDIGPIQNKLPNV